MSDIAIYSIIYKHVDAINYSGVYISKELYRKSVECYKELAFMVENNEFFRYYLTVFLDKWDIFIRMFDNRMYMDHSITQEDLDDIRQWKSR